MVDFSGILQWTALGELASQFGSWKEFAVNGFGGFCIAEEIVEG